MTEVGVIHGRFQGLHNDHLTYLLAGKARCRHLVVGITNPDPTLAKEDPADPGRSGTARNPLTYFERYTLIRAALVEAGTPWEEFSVVPLPINFPELYRHYVPLDAVFYLTIYDSWGRKKLDMFRSLGLKTEVMWEKPPSGKGITGSELRRRMIAGESWEDLVPTSSAVLMAKWRVPERLRRMQGLPGGASQ
ncbi:MAG: nicotinate-nucleotide adenylyltransferase [Desulfomonile tiedjei]|nr:nicotinate-nucleotide adenylyltransferase [Desulfomonile tiedjei]